MPEIRQSLPVSGTATADSGGMTLVLSHRLDGYDTFLTGQLELDGAPPAPVQILTFDDVTVLRLLDQAPSPLPSSWAGILHLAHGWRSRKAPDDLRAAARTANRNLDALDGPELRYALTFLGEAGTEAIRKARIDAIVNALPALGALA